MNELIPSPISVNHGNVFGTKKWYTFHCPKCKRQVVREETEKEGCNHCGQILNWRGYD